MCEASPSTPASTRWQPRRAGRRSGHIIRARQCHLRVERPLARFIHRQTATMQGTTSSTAFSLSTEVRASSPRSSAAASAINGPCGRALDRPVFRKQSKRAASAPSSAPLRHHRGGAARQAERWTATYPPRRSPAPAAPTASPALDVEAHRERARRDARRGRRPPAPESHPTAPRGSSRAPSAPFFWPPDRRFCRTPAALATSADAAATFVGETIAAATSTTAPAQAPRACRASRRRARGRARSRATRRGRRRGAAPPPARHARRRPVARGTGARSPARRLRWWR